MKAPLSKLALAVVLLNSSIYISAGNDSYLEDDLSYTSVSEMQSEGWHWGLSSANASCIDYSDCVPGDDGYEHFPVTGYPFEDLDPWDFGGGDGFDDPNDPGEGEIGSGDSGTDPDAQAYNECINAAEAGRAPCIEGRTNDINLAGDICYLDAAIAGSAAGVYLSPLTGIAVTFLTGSACIAAKYYDLSQVSSYCSGIVDQQKAACG